MKKNELKKKSESRLRAIKSSYKDKLYAYIDSVNTMSIMKYTLKNWKIFFKKKHQKIYIWHKVNIW